MRSLDPTSISTVATIIVEPHDLWREALSSLTSNLSYRVVASIACASEIHTIPVTRDTHRLVILGSQSAETFAKSVAEIRKCWPDCKIVLLFDHVSKEDCHKLFESDADGCMPLFVSRQTLAMALELIIFSNARVMVLTEHSAASIAPEVPSGAEIEYRYDENGPRNVEPTGAFPLAPRKGGDHVLAATPRNSRKLSEREWQILNGLVKGQPNKVIAKDYNITEATVKVHMKAILRKIQAGNRTQAAIWAIENRDDQSVADDRAIRPGTPLALPRA